MMCSRALESSDTYSVGKIAAITIEMPLKAAEKIYHIQMYRRSYFNANRFYVTPTIKQLPSAMIKKPLIRCNEVDGESVDSLTITRDINRIRCATLISFDNKDLAGWKIV